MRIRLMVSAEMELEKTIKYYGYRSTRWKLRERWSRHRLTAVNGRAV